jgi:hypothetical protein
MPDKRQCGMPILFAVPAQLPADTGFDEWLKDGLHGRAEGYAQFVIYVGAGLAAGVLLPKVQM